MSRVLDDSDSTLRFSFRDTVVKHRGKQTETEVEKGVEECRGQ